MQHLCLVRLAKSWRISLWTTNKGNGQQRGCGATRRKILSDNEEHEFRGHPVLMMFTTLANSCCGARQRLTRAPSPRCTIITPPPIQFVCARTPPPPPPSRVKSESQGGQKLARARQRSFQNALAARHGAAARVVPPPPPPQQQPHSQAT